MFDLRLSTRLSLAGKATAKPEMIVKKRAACMSTGKRYLHEEKASEETSKAYKRGSADGMCCKGDDQDERTGTGNRGDWGSDHTFMVCSNRAGRTLAHI